MTLPKHKTFFVIPNYEKCCALTYELHFSTLSKFFPLQKVNFPVPKIPLGKIYFLSLLARKTRTRARMKKRAKGRKKVFLRFCLFNLPKIEGYLAKPNSTAAAVQHCSAALQQQLLSTLILPIGELVTPLENWYSNWE